MAARFTASEAADELKISVNTLYAYVSRGLIRSESGPANGRDRRYNAEDVRRLKARREQRRDPLKATETALHWGNPVMESGITEIRDGQLYYRGLDAVSLARDYSAEEVAAFLWTGELRRKVPVSADTESGDVPAPPNPEAWSDAVALVQRTATDLSATQRFQVVLPLIGAADPAAHDLRPAQLDRTGGRILNAMARIATLTGSDEAKLPVAQLLQRDWAPGFVPAAALIDNALVLCADHELNTSTFAARCVASTGASLYGVVIAGLCALQGVRHGGSTERVSDFLHAVAAQGRPGPVIAGYLRRGEPIPGFGHPLYPAGDPRGQALLEAIFRTCPSSSALSLAKETELAVGQLLEARPNIDFGLVVLADCLQLPSGAPLTLFALGRTVGWVAHAMEQYASGEMIRPRARYVGPVQ